MPVENHSEENPALEQRFSSGNMPKQMQTHGEGLGDAATDSSPTNPAGLSSNDGEDRSNIEDGFRESRLADLGAMSSTPASTASDDPEGLISANSSMGVNTGFEATGTSVGRMQATDPAMTTIFAEEPTGGYSAGMSDIGEVDNSPEAAGETSDSDSGIASAGGMAAPNITSGSDAGDVGMFREETPVAGAVSDAVISLGGGAQRAGLADDEVSATGVEGEEDLAGATVAGGGPQTGPTRFDDSATVAGS